MHSGEFRGCPRNGKALVEDRSTCHCRAHPRREGERSARPSPETGLRSGLVRIAHGTGDRDAGGVAHGQRAWRSVPSGIRDSAALPRRAPAILRVVSSTLHAVRGCTVHAESCPCRRRSPHRARRRAPRPALSSRRRVRRDAGARRRCGERATVAGAEGRRARSRRGDRVAQSAADVRTAGRPDGDRKRRDPAQRRAEPGRAAAAPARRGNHDERGAGRRRRARSCAARTAARRSC